MPVELTEDDLLKLAVIACRSFVTMRAATYKDYWIHLVDLGFLCKEFSPWGRPQYRITASECTWDIVFDNIVPAAAAAMECGMLNVSHFLIGKMNTGHLPELLSHPNEKLREAASARLLKLTSGASEQK